MTFRTILSILFPLLAFATATAAPPNIVIVLADDLAFRDIGCYGNKEVRTPHLDKLAQQGMRFTHAFCATAMCSPCRQQLLTGVFPVRNGAYPNHSHVYEGTRSLVHDVQDVGYRVGLYGKKHFGPANSFPLESLKKGRNQKAAEVVTEFFGRSNDQPFCLIYASNSPHTPWTESEGKPYNADQLTVPADFVDTPQTRQALAAYYGEVSAFDRELGDCMHALDKAGVADNTIVIALSEQGCNFPGGKWTCYDLGLRCGMIIRWPRRVKPGTTCDALVQYVDILPTLVEACGGTLREGLDGKSLRPLFDDPKANHHNFVFGVQTTRGIIAGNEAYPIRSVRNQRYKLIRNLNAGVPFQNVVTEQDREGYWKSWVDAASSSDTAKHLVNRYRNRPAVEFYDLKNDPLELKNLAGSTEHQGLIAELDSELSRWMKQQGDLGLATERAAFSRQPKHKSNR